MSSADVNPLLGSYADGNASPEPESRSRNAAAREEFDDLFDYDPGIDNIFRDVDTNMDVPTTVGKGAKSTSHKGTNNVAGLGIEEEVQITRKKRVNVKLDENRLLSQAGIPKLRKIAKERMRFRGKGHEYSDAARILSLYQLWLDDLYPKAKFADALTMVEKLGHSKQMRIMRKGWIEGNGSRTIGNTSGNTNSHTAEPDMHSLFRKSVGQSGQNAGINAGIAARESIFGEGLQNTSGQRALARVSDQDGSEDLYSSPEVKRATKSMSKPNGGGGGGSGGLFVSDDEVPGDGDANGGPEDSVSGEDKTPEEDELDALLNEGATGTMSNDMAIEGGKVPNATTLDSKTRAEEEFDDEMEAMMGDGQHVVKQNMHFF